MTIYYKVFGLFLLFFPFCLSAQEDTNKTSDINSINTQLLENLDSLSHLYYVQQALKIQNIGYDKSGNSDIVPIFSDSVYASRLAAISSIIPLPYNNQVKAYIEVYTARKRKFVQAMLGLTDYYFPIFEEIFSAYGLPEEFKYLAIVESALNPRAVSRVGATGVWQFMYTTGKIYNLEINSFVDERRDPVKATYAAAEFLTELYALYGDWTLAMAAYNCGPGNVNKAIKRSGGKTNFWEIFYYLPKETRGYVPSFIAATYLMNYYKEHNLVPMEMFLPLVTDTIMVKQEASLSKIASIINIDEELLLDLNTQYKTDIIPAKTKSYPLRLPSNFATVFLDFEDSIYKKTDTLTVPQAPVEVNVHVKQEQSQQSQPSDKTAIFYTVKSGDNLGYIASWFNVSLTSIKLWNNMKSSLIRPGQKIVIYVPDSKAEYYKRFNSMSLSEKQATIGKSAPSTPSSPKTDNFVYYTVRSGDTLWAIAKKYPGITEQEIMRLNGISNAKGIKPGQKLKIPKK